MPTAETLVTTPRPKRYLDQLASHFEHGPGGARIQPQDAWDLQVDFGRATLCVSAHPDGLLVQVTAPDAQQLRQMQRRVASRLAQIGRRDGLIVTWDDAPNG